MSLHLFRILLHSWVGAFYFHKVSQRWRKLSSRNRIPLVHFGFLDLPWRKQQHQALQELSSKSKFTLKNWQCCICAALCSCRVVQCLHCANCICHPCRARGVSAITERRYQCFPSLLTAPPSRNSHIDDNQNEPELVTPFKHSSEIKCFVFLQAGWTKAAWQVLLISQQVAITTWAQAGLVLFSSACQHQLRRGD